MSAGGGRTERVGRYRLDEVIGVGSFATAHRATDERLDDTVVVKILAENHSLNPDVRERFIAEGRSLRRVRSAHVVTVHDIGESERQQPYLVLEHADRGTLADRVVALRGSGWTPSRADVLTLATSLAQALEAVHSAQLVHRDLSPTNVLLTSNPESTRSPEGQDPSDLHPGLPAARLIRPDERLLLADLGMCKDLAVNSGLTVAGGTAGFRPPEMDGGPAIIDTRADLWSLSALVRWLCDAADLPPVLDQVLERSLAADPEQRHQDVVDWLRDVEAALAPQDPDPPIPDAAAELGPDGGVSDSPSATPPSGWRRRQPWIALIAALVLGMGGGWLIRGSGAPPEATSTARIAIEGPSTTAVGESATFTVRHLGVSSWVWVLPSGAHVAGEESVTLVPRTEGTATLTLSARDDEGRELRTEHDLSVSEP